MYCSYTLQPVEIFLEKLCTNSFLTGAKFQLIEEDSRAAVYLMSLSDVRNIGLVMWEAFMTSGYTSAAKV